VGVAETRASFEEYVRGRTPALLRIAYLVLADAIRRLTPRQRAVLVLRYYEDRTETEAAILLGVSTGTIKSQTRHALRRLREVAPELADLVGVAR
jgi:RNA polymerase sigma factor (sigma-70 family)